MCVLRILWFSAPDPSSIFKNFNGTVPFVYACFFCDVVETKTWLKHRDWEYLQDFKICGFCQSFSKKYHHYLQVELFSNFENNFSSLLGCFLPANKANRNSLNYVSFTKPFPCDIQSLMTIDRQWLKPVAFDTMVRPETIDTETCKKRSWDTIT